MIVACSMLFPLAIAVLYRESCGWIFLLLLPVTLFLGWALVALFRPGKQELHIQVRDGAAIATYGWILATLVGMMPYLLTGTFTTVTDAFF